jgi:hypothetical protein
MNQEEGYGFGETNIHSQMLSWRNCLMYVLGMDSLLFLHLLQTKFEGSESAQKILHLGDGVQAETVGSILIMEQLFNSHLL